MKSVSYSEFRKQLAQYLDAVEEDREPIIINRSKGRKAVLMSFEDYSTNEATLHLMSSRENIRVIDEAIAELESGGGVEIVISNEE